MEPINIGAARGNLRSHSVFLRKLLCLVKDLLEPLLQPAVVPDADKGELQQLLAGAQVHQSAERRESRVELSLCVCYRLLKRLTLKKTSNFWLILANFERLVLGFIDAKFCRIRIRSRLVFEKKENLGVCAKRKVRLTRLGKYYVVQYRCRFLQVNFEV